MISRTAPAILVATLLFSGGLGAQRPGAPDDAPSLARAGQLVAAALAHANQGRSDDALDAADAAERALGSTAGASVRADIEHVRGLIAQRRGLIRESISHHERELESATQAGSNVLMARAYDRLATVSANTGQHAKVLEYAQRGFELTPNPTDRDRALFLLRLGIAYDEFQDIPKAEKTLKEAYEVARRTGDIPVIARVLNAWGVVYVRTDLDLKRATELFDEALQLLEGRTDRESLMQRARLLNNSGNVFRDDLATADEALARYREALAIDRRLEIGTGAPFNLKNIGRVLRMQGHYAESEHSLLEAVRLADITLAGRIRWQARMELGTLLAGRDPERAERYYRETLDLLEGQHSNVLLEDYSAGAISGDLSMYDNPYDLLVNLLIKQSRAGDALPVAERARARAFLDTLATDREALATAVPRDYVRSEQELLRRISENQAELRALDVAPQRRTELAAAIQTDEDRLTAIRVRLATEHPEIAHARYPHLLSMEEIQQSLLGPEDALLEYFLGADASTLWIVTRTEVATVRLPSKGDITAAVRGYVDALSAPDTDYVRARSSVSSVLPPDAMSRLTGVRRLLVIPDGILHYLPFEALESGDGRFLIERYVVSYAPSASSLAFLRSRPPLPEGTVVAVGNPLMNGEGADTERGLPIERLGFLKPLPYTQKELDAVASLYRGTLVLQEQQATEPELARLDLERAAIVHFATHGIIDEDQPQRSGLALTMVAPQSDGLLQTREIYRLRLRAALVTLSACQTALGKAVTGEGMIGMARAFFHAGARSVMASLWNVNDASTAEFMRGFYRALRAGQRIDESARTAKLAFLAGDDRLRHPYFWAAFVVSGDAGAPVRVVPAPLAVAPIAALIAAAAAASLGGALVVRFRRRRT